MSKEKIQEIIDDLFLIDPELKKYEVKIRKIIISMIKEKPDAKLDKRFINRLKERLLIEDYDVAGDSQKFWERIKHPALVWASAATVMAFILLVTVSTDFVRMSRVGYQAEDESSSKNNISQTISMFGKGVRISKVSSNSLGNIMSSSGGSTQESTPSSVVMGMGGGGGIAAMSAPVASDNSAKMVDSRMIYPYVRYSFVYDGEQVDLSDKVSVYQRIRSGAAKTALAQKIKEVDFGFFDINKFSNLELNSFDISENRDFGYALSVSLADDSASVYQNWQKWNNGNQSYSPLNESDVPSEDIIISSAKDFVANYGIDTTPFGEPELNQYSYRVMYKTDLAATSYIPDTMGVVFPLSLDGYQVYEQNGQKVGLNVDFNIRQGKVMSVNQIYNQEYVKSDYSGQSDWDKILNAAENGGYPGLSYMPESDVQVVEIHLGTPVKGLIRTWTYDNATGQSQELFAEGLIFPLKDKPEGYYNDYITVPLVKSWWDGIEENTPATPLMRGGAEPAIAL